MKRLEFALQSKHRAVAFLPVQAEVAMPPEEIEGWVLIDEQAQEPVPVQVEGSAVGSRVHWVVGSLAPGERKSYVLAPSADVPECPPVEISEQADGCIEVKAGGELFTGYHMNPPMPRPVLYPLIGPFGDGVTRAYPMESVEGDSTDHVHHRSVWSAWGDVNGADVWSEEEGSGRVVHRCFERCCGGPVFGDMVSLNDWVDAEGKKLLEDRLELRFYNLPGRARTFDFSVTFHATEGDVRFGDTKEGGIIAVRVAASVQGDREGRIENSLGGISEEETWGKRASWCDYAGPVNGRTVGLAVFDHPGNLRYPTYWHVRDYGLMTANPFGLSHFLQDEEADGSFVLKAGQSLRFLYRVFVHAGSAGEAAVRENYLNWLFPPGVEIQQ